MILIISLQPEISETNENKEEEIEANEKETEASENDEDITMSEAITNWMDSTHILRISKQNVK